MRNVEIVAPPEQFKVTGVVPEYSTDEIRPESRATYAMRQTVVAPPFGNLRYGKRLDRFHYRGETKANGQWLLYCLVHDTGRIATLAPGYRKNAGDAPATAGHRAREAA